MRSCSIILILFSYTVLQAQPVQQYRFMNFGAKDGLTDKYVYDAVQDNVGYMWFGTATGLYRYDGHRFQKFRSTVDEPGRTITNTLQALAKDEAGNLWLGSINTLQWMNPVSHTFRAPDFNNPIVAKMTKSVIQRILPAKKGGMWIGTNTGYFFRFNSDSSFTHFSNYPPTATKAVANVIETDNEIYAVHTEGLYCFTSSGKLISSHVFPFKAISNGFFEQKSNTILITTEEKGVLRFNINTKAFDSLLENELFRKQISFCIEPLTDGGYLIGSYPLHYINPTTKAFFSFEQSKDDYKLHNTKIVRIFTDREENIWLCGHSGLSMIPFQNSQIETIKLQDKSTVLGVEPVQVFAVPGGNDILVTNTTSQGLVVYNSVSKLFETVVNPLPVERKRIFGLITAPDSTLYLSDRLHLFQYLPDAKKMRSYSLTDQYGKPVRDVGRNVFDKDGTVYITSLNNGFYVWNYPEQTATHINKSDVDSKNADNNILSPCLIDSKNNCWFTSSNGVYRFIKKEKRYSHITTIANRQLPPMGITMDAAEDKLGHIWIVTQSGGLYEWYEENGKQTINNYTSASGIGLPADFNWRIMQSPVDSMLWISNVAGLLRFDPVKKKVVSVFSKQNGLSEDDGGYTFNILNNRVLAQLYYGVLHLMDLNTYRFNPVKPQVQLESLKVMGKEFVYTIDSSHQEIRLDADENFLQFEFAALVFNNSNRNQYAWMMEGVDKDWIYAGNENRVNYSRLQPGTYTFKVKAANNDGLWGDELQIKITIRPPFYASWWFISFCVIALASILFYWNRYRVSQARKEEQLKANFQQQIAETEMKALRAQMNPHFIFNSLNSIQKYILKNEHFEASQYLTKFSRLIRLILDHSDQNSITLSSELDLLKLYVEMESLRFDNKFDYKILVDEHLNIETGEIPSMLIQPYVENAIWHGLLHKEEKGLLTIHFSKKENNRLHVMIEDNGIGRERAVQLRSKQILKKKSYGMQITENRIAVINRTHNINASCEIIDLKDAAGNAAGTRVVLDIPLKPLNA